MLQGKFTKTDSWFQPPLWHYQGGRLWVCVTGELWCCNRPFGDGSKQVLPVLLQRLCVFMTSEVWLGTGCSCTITEIIFVYLWHRWVVMLQQACQWWWETGRTCITTKVTCFCDKWGVVAVWSHWLCDCGTGELWCCNRAVGDCGKQVIPVLPQRLRAPSGLSSGQWLPAQRSHWVSCLHWNLSGKS